MNLCSSIQIYTNSHDKWILRLKSNWQNMKLVNNVIYDKTIKYPKTLSKYPNVRWINWNQKYTKRYSKNFPVTFYQNILNSSWNSKNTLNHDSILKSNITYITAQIIWKSGILWKNIFHKNAMQKLSEYTGH